AVLKNDGLSSTVTLIVHHEMPAPCGCFGSPTPTAKDGSGSKRMASDATVAVRFHKHCRPARDIGRQSCSPCRWESCVLLWSSWSARRERESSSAPHASSRRYRGETAAQRRRLCCRSPSTHRGRGRRHDRPADERPTSRGL